MQEVALLLHNIRSTHNVGSIFRTADAAGVTHLYLSGYTPRPTDRFGRAQPDIAKTALGAEKTMPWEYHTSPMRIITKLKKEGWKVMGVEQDARSIDYRDARVAGKTLIVVGNEVRGMSKGLRYVCDIIVEIPMHGSKESLNVSVAMGIVLFALLS
jgi:tRNA G18 (ribose-2'-O)-methylase SpoU